MVATIFWYVVFNTVTTVLCKSERPVSMIVVCWKLLHLFVKTRPIHRGLSELKQVGSFNKLLRSADLYPLYQNHLVAKKLHTFYCNDQLLYQDY